MDLFFVWILLEDVEKSEFVFKDKYVLFKGTVHLFQVSLHFNTSANYKFLRKKKNKDDLYYTVFGYP